MRTMIHAAISEPEQRPDFQVIWTMFYISILAVYWPENVSAITRWLPINGPILYPQVPQVFLQYWPVMALKWSFLLFCGYSSLRLIGYRFTSALALIAGFIFIFLTYAAGRTNHQHQLPLIVLALFSIGSLFERHLTKWQVILLARISFCLVFFTAGLTKLNELGSAWFDYKLHMAYLLINRFSYGQNAADSLIDLNLFFIENLNFLLPLFYMALPLELLMPLALLPRFRILIVLVAGMQFFASEVLYATFIPYIPVYLVWLNRAETKSIEKVMSGLAVQKRLILNYKTQLWPFKS